MGRLDGKVALVTGGANGIGRACAERLVEEGAAVVVADLLEEPGRAAADAIQASGGRATFVRYDAREPADNDAAVAAAVDAYGSLDVAVTAAGISYAGYRSGETVSLTRMAGLADPVGTFTSLPVDDFRQVLEVNLVGTFLALQATVRQMAAQGRGGAIVTISSIAAKWPEGGIPSYGASKAAVWMLTKSTARLVAPLGIRVNSVGPGFIETNMTAPLRADKGIYELFAGQIPMGRMGMPREVANAVVFLASDEASYFTGELLHPDGGFYTD